MRRWFIPVVAFFLPVLMGALATYVPGLTSATAKKSPWNADYFPNSTVISQDGKTHKFYDDLVKDKTIVVNFIFTGCTQLCPLTTARLAQVQEQLGEAVGRDIFFYSISLDPENDTPAALKKFADSFKAGPGWLFLTGKSDELKLIRDRLGERSRDRSEHQAVVILANDRTGEWKKDSVMSEIEHIVETIKDLDPAHRARPQSKPEAGQISGNEVLPFKNVMGQALFTRGCATCHTIGKGDRIGPDLASVTTRRNREWLSGFIKHPDKVRESGDPIALELFDKYNRVIMPSLGLSDADVSDVLSFIDGETAKSKTATAAAAPAK